MRAAALLSLFALGACKEKEVAVQDDDDAAEEVDCLGADPFVAGQEMMTTSGRYVSIVTATPTPPDVGDNVWTLAVRSDTGPVTDLTLEVTPWMPLHGHGLVPPKYTTTEAGDGEYELAPFDLIMPGAWEFTIDLGSDDTAVIMFCAEG